MDCDIFRAPAVELEVPDAAPAAEVGAPPRHRQRDVVPREHRGEVPVGIPLRVRLVVPVARARGREARKNVQKFELSATFRREIFL